MDRLPECDFCWRFPLPFQFMSSVFARVMGALYVSAMALIQGAFWRSVLVWRVVWYVRDDRFRLALRVMFVSMGVMVRFRSDWFSFDLIWIGGSGVLSMLIFFSVMSAVADCGFWLSMLDDIMAWMLVWLMLMFFGIFWSSGMSERICWLVWVLRFRSEVVDSHHVLESGCVHVPVSFKLRGAWLAVVLRFRLYW